MKRTLVGLVGFLFVISVPSALGQSTLFNVPTTDTVAKGKVYVELDYLPQIPKPDASDRLHTINPRLVAGLLTKVEIGANFPFNHTTGVTETTIQPNIKWKFASNNAKGLAAAVGGILYTPINHRRAVDTYSLVYASFSKKVKTSNYGPRFTAGPYGVVSGGSGWIGPKAGAMLGYEQPIHAKATIVVDWFSGKNVFGYFTPGISITPSTNGIFNVGYSLGNVGGNDNRFLFVYYGITF